MQRGYYRLRKSKGPFSSAIRDAWRTCRSVQRAADLVLSFLVDSEHSRGLNYTDEEIADGWASAVEFFLDLLQTGEGSGLEVKVMRGGEVFLIGPPKVVDPLVSEASAPFRHFVSLTG